MRENYNDYTFFLNRPDLTRLYEEGRSVRKVSVLFVCHGNICRSPMAESYFTWLVGRKGLAQRFAISSAATHPDELGNPPHRGTREKLAEEGIPLIAHRARLLERADGERCDFILGMDAENLRHMHRILGDCRAKVGLLLDDAPHPRAIADPWYTGDFDATFADVAEGCRTFLEKLQREKLV